MSKLTEEQVDELLDELSTERDDSIMQSQDADAAFEYIDNLARLPRISLGALFMPAVWGPAHGQWVTILFYPLWIFADSCFVNGLLAGGLAAVLAASVFVGTALITIFYALSAHKRAYLRVAGRISLERYLRRERIWVFISLGIALVLIALATWYNLSIRLPQGMVFPEF